MLALRAHLVAPFTLISVPRVQCMLEARQVLPLLWQKLQEPNKLELKAPVQCMLEAPQVLQLL